MVKVVISYDRIDRDNKRDEFISQFDHIMADDLNQRFILIKK